jgi:HAD superfamily hydrolase (TIGR01509 family)
LLGLRNADILPILLGDLTDAEVAALAGEKEEMFRELISGTVEALAGAKELLQQASGAGMQQAIVSSTPRQNIELIAGALGILQFLDAIVGDEDVARGKPDPEPYLLGAERLGVRPPDCVVIEDAPEGIEAGQAAGMRCVGVATTRPPEKLVAADLVVTRLDDPAVARFLFGA